MNKISFPLTVVLAAGVMVTSCTKEAVTPDIIKTIQLPANGHAVVTAGNTFAFNFFKKAIAQDSATSNKIISPLSIYLALAMVYNGADNATKDSIANLLQLSGISISDLNNACQSLMQQLPGEDSKVQLSIANSIWYNKNVQPLPPFISTVQNYYLAGCQPLDFSDPGSVPVINNWISQHTANKIQNVLQSISPDDLMYLVNAIYFNGAWKNGFDAKKTATNKFYLQGGGTVNVPFMNQQLTTKVYTDNSMTLFELPYGGGGSYSMYVALPVGAGQTVNELAASVNSAALAEAISRMDSATIQLALPSWEYAYAISDMRPVLSSLGMEIAFSDAADFSGMYTTKVNISKAIHKAYIKVNEQGTIAAAATVIGVTPTVSLLPDTITVDHPFLYVIVEKQTGTVLFIGTVNNPALQ